jgi:hypothetical protein
MEVWEFLQLIHQLMLQHFRSFDFLLLSWIVFKFHLVRPLLLLQLTTFLNLNICNIIQDLCIRLYLVANVF